MAVELVFAPEVRIDIGEANAWYEERRPGLGEDFLGCVHPPKFAKRTEADTFGQVPTS
jgi:hypothetical protein